MAVCVPSVVSNFCTLLKHRYTYHIHCEHLNQILSRLQEIRTGHHKMTEQSHIKLSVIVLFSTQAARLWSEIKTAFGGNDTSLSSMKNLNTIKLFFLSLSKSEKTLYDDRLSFCFQGESVKRSTSSFALVSNLWLK